MNKKALLLLLLVLCIGLFSCNHKAAKTGSQKTDNSKNTADSTKTDTSKIFQRQKLYVIAPNGLSLRKENSLESQKLIGMPLGSQVLLLEKSNTANLEIEHIKGNMLKVSFDGQVGYAFSGYVSPIWLRSENEDIEAYLTKLKETFPSVSFESKRTNPDFHEGIIDTITLPASSWSEAFYLISAIYELPKSLGFPNPTGSDKELLEEPNKPEETWFSELDVERANNTLTKITYNYRTEGFGDIISLTRLESNKFQVEHIGFVD
ncbi:MAG: SH3 domain-containing protein [Maribacter sp.]